MREYTNGCAIDLESEEGTWGGNNKSSVLEWKECDNYIVMFFFISCPGNNDNQYREGYSLQQEHR